jgi:hypothetical protein
MSNDLSQDDSLVKEFLVESEELLQKMDQDMVALGVVTARWRTAKPHLPRDPHH